MFLGITFLANPCLANSAGILFFGIDEIIAIGVWAVNYMFV